MLDRRQLLATGLSLPGLLLTAAAPVAGPRGTASRAPLAVLVDHRHAASRAFGAAQAARGARVVACDGDVSTAWRELFGPLRLAGAGAVAGLTSPVALHCLERLALLQGLWVTSREPPVGADGGWRHDAAGLAGAALVRWQIAAGPRA